MAQATHITTVPRSSKRRVVLIVAAALVASALIAGFTLPATGGSGSPTSDGMSTAARQAWADRYQGLADAFPTGTPTPLPTPVVEGTPEAASGTELSPAHNAEAQRLKGIAGLYGVDTSASSLSHQAETARWQGIVDWYLVSPSGMSRAHQAEANRWQAIADQYFTGLARGHQAEADRWQGIADSFSD